MKEVKTPKKPLIFYYLIALVVLMLFNMLVTPSLFSARVEEVGYGEFLQMAEERDLAEVQVTDTEIIFSDKDTPPNYYKTGRMDDPFLVDKLLREEEGIFLWCLEGLHRLIGNKYQFSISGKARENMETVKRSSNNVIEFLQSEGYIRFRADSEASSKAIYEAYTRWCDDNAQKPMSANRVSSELAQNERLYNVEATNNVHVGGKRVRGFVGIEVVNPPPY